MAKNNSNRKDSNSGPENDKDLLDPRKMTRRQGWGIGYLSETFYKAGRFFEQGEDKTADAKIELHKVGFDADEIDPIVRHFNAAVDGLSKQTPAVQREVLQALEKSIKLKLRKPPAPPKP